MFLDDSDQAVNRALRNNAVRARLAPSRYWPQDQPVRRENITGSFNIIGGSPAVSSQDLQNTFDEQTYGHFPDGALVQEGEHDQPYDDDHVHQNSNAINQ